MPTSAVVLIHPPVVKPCEPPAGIARLAGALRTHGVACTVLDANIDGIHHLLHTVVPAADTWFRRAHRHLENHLDLLRRAEGYRRFAPYSRAVADIGRLLAQAGAEGGIKVGLADFRDTGLAPVRSADLGQAAREPRRNPFYDYFQNHFLPRVVAANPTLVGISVNFLSQALCGFALAGMIRQALPGVRIILGGGLITSWMQHAGGPTGFPDLALEMVAGPGEKRLLQMAGVARPQRYFVPDYGDLKDHPYLSPGFILPFSASSGCWWRRCAFCPERAEGRPFQPLPRWTAVEQLRHLVHQTNPSLIHLLDNALSPALLKSMASHPPGAPWYGFVRIGAPLDDPEFCHRLARAGCVMLKIGLESGSQAVLDRLQKGVQLQVAARVLDNLHRAGIATYVYLLFGTPAEDDAAARKTLDFAVDHHSRIGFLNVAIFNLPLGSPEAGDLDSRDFYEGDLALYRDFSHPAGWDRAVVRRFVERTFKKHPAIQPIIQRDPPIFTSNHAAFFRRSV